MTLERYENESDLSYHKRMVYGKLIDKTLADVDYTELADAVYGQEYSSDVARRMMYGSCKTLQLIDKDAEDSVSGSDIIDEIRTNKIELQKERQRFYDQRREFNTLVRNEGRYEHIIDRLADAAENLSDSVGVMFTDCKVSDNQNAENDAVLVLSDWHYGMVADNIWNEYDTVECKRRVDAIVNKAIDRMWLHGCQNLYVVVLGDLIHGAVHTSARVASEELVADQLMQASEILAQAIEALSRYAMNTYVYTTYGNHARTVQNKKDNIHSDNIERFIPWWLEQRLSRHDDIKVMNTINSYEFIYMNVRGHGICASHGDLDNVKTSTRMIPTIFNKVFGKDVEYILLGDKHHRESFDELGVTSIICGSLCGTDDYANDRRLYSNPEQLLLIVNDENGVDAQYNLKC